MIEPNWKTYAKKSIKKFCNLLESLDNKNNTIVKIGICCYEDDQTISGIDGLIDCSHLALNAYIPGQTNNYYFYNSKMHDQMIRKVEIENNMESALLNNEFTFYLQPKYAPNGQVMLGAEALVRWLEHQEISLCLVNSFQSLNKMALFLKWMNIYLKVFVSFSINELSKPAKCSYID